MTKSRNIKEKNLRGVFIMKKIILAAIAILCLGIFTACGGDGWKDVAYEDVTIKVPDSYVKKEFDNYISSKHPKEQKEFLYSVQKQFLNKYKKNNAVEWLCSIIQGEKYNVKAGAFIYDVLSQIGIFNKKDYQLKPKEKYDLVKNYFTR